ncbi:MAG TPA: FecR domain-containing protein [Steroidobacteraceae bacterium]
MKPKTQASKADRLILEEASEWFVDFRVGDVDAAARERFDEWLRRSPEHIRAYMEIAKIYVELPAFKMAGVLDVDSLIACAHSGENVVAFGKTDSTRPQRAEGMATETHLRDSQAMTLERHPRRRFLAAAAAIVLSIAAVAWWNAEQHPLYATDIGERRSITLTDGSTVDLNARSKLRIDFSKNERRVELLEGQALFQVAKDSTRAFIVASGTATVRAVGTQFDVYRKDSGTTVTVLEGRVAVYSTPPGGGSEAPPAAKSRPFSDSPSASVQPHASATSHSNAKLPIPTGLTDPSQTAAIFLSAGEQVTVTPAEVLPMPAQADIAATTAWMERRLIFDGSKLSDVVQEFNRYNRRQLVIDGTQLSDFHVSGVYSSTDPASLIRFLREQPGLKITEDDNQVLITAR